jgi:CDP-diacylglycerol--glycerol-3-phosphate 3-phosphatidyltransferase
LSTARGLRSARIVAVYTWLRIVLTPVVMALIMIDGSSAGGLSVVALAVFVVAAATDYLDGVLARRWKVTTTLGSFLDTTADKLLVTGVLFALVAVERASPWIAALIVAREMAVLGLRGVIAAEGTVMSPSRLGKVKTAVQLLAISLAIVRPGDPVGGLYVDEWAMLAAAAITVASAIDYFTTFASSLSQRSAS